VKGLTDGPIKTQHFRLHLEDLKKTIEFSLEGNLSPSQAHVHSSSYRAVRILWTSPRPTPKHLKRTTKPPYLVGTTRTRVSELAIVARSRTTSPTSARQPDPFSGQVEEPALRKDPAMPVGMGGIPKEGQ
jgi:hypothetical protein